MKNTYIFPQCVQRTHVNYVQEDNVSYLLSILILKIGNLQKWGNHLKLENFNMRKTKIIGTAHI